MPAAWNGQAARIGWRRGRRRSPDLLHTRSGRSRSGVVAVGARTGLPEEVQAASKAAARHNGSRQFQEARL